MLSPIECVKNVVECDNRRDAEGYRQLLHDDYVSYVHGNQQNSGAETEVAALSSWWRATSDVHLEILEIGETNGLVTLRYTLNGTNDGEFFGRPASGKTFKVENCTLFRIVSGRVKETYRYSDTMGLMTQLGLMPART
ncbi:MAG: ester cyclase [Myxococcota bacterium]